MKPKTKQFDAVLESRKWRAEAHARLSKMTPEERMNFLNAQITTFPAKGRTMPQAEPVAS